MAPAMTPTAADRANWRFSMVTPLQIQVAVKKLREAVEAGHLDPPTFDTLIKLIMQYGPLEYQTSPEPSLREVVGGAWASWAEAGGVQLELPLELDVLDGL